jgi:hypothetical protein
VLSASNAASDRANPPSVSPKLGSNKHSSGESSDAGRWFETTNNKAQQRSKTVVDSQLSDPRNGNAADSGTDEPPFFLRNSSSSETPPDSYMTQHAGVDSTIPYRPGMARTGTDGGSSTEDFRSVIDDLTIANKKLRHRLKKYERVHDEHLQDEKLFEVRFHGLPDHKKKELEDTLRKFAASLDEAATDYPTITTQAPVLEQQKTASSTSRFAESGYASMSASGQNSSTPSNQASNLADDNRKMSRSAYNRQQQSIQSYLHDIPAGLLPNNNVPMTDKSKKKLAVRRLEQIFAGKKSVPGTHPQPMQQEEVAQSAASADREQREATGRHLWPEGLRVARIMPEDGRRGDIEEQDEALQRLRPSLHVGEQDFAGFRSPDQRPTRPLDLDPSRAQVSEDNMDYIRHLGFTPPDMETGEAPQEGHGWLYLNLLINMAQLHSLNVTPEFVKDALTEYSSQLELSRDGRKVRWKGGLGLTRHNSNSPSEFDNDRSPPESRSPSKRIKTNTGGSSNDSQLDSEHNSRKLAQAQRERELSKFAYTPMFFRKDDSEDGQESYGFDVESSGASLQPPQHAGNSSGLGSSARQSGSSSQNRRDDGPMIFYNRAKFCTDLSGDRLGASLIAPGAYKAITSQPLGAISHTAVASQRVSDLDETRGPMDATPMDVDSNSGSRMSTVDGFGFSPAALQNDTSGSDSPADIMDFEASGLGGVHPEDNFSIRVRRSQTQSIPRGPVGRRRSSVYPRKIHNVLADAKTSRSAPTSPVSPPRIIQEKILSASRKTLPVSTLPPASFLPFDSTSSGDVDSDLDSNVSSAADSEADSESENGPATALQLLNMSPGHRLNASDSESEGSSDYSDDSDDGSVDFLATARQLDPNTIRNQEREYDAAVADRLAEEIVAGSSAATAGGGSGFNTPALIMNMSQQSSSKKKNQSTSSGSMSSRTKLKRTRTSETLAPMKKKSQRTTG